MCWTSNVLSALARLCQPQSRRVNFVLSSGDTLECVDKFCYLGDMIGKGGGAVEAVRYRVRCAWGKFNEIRPLLASRGFPLKLKGKLYRTCVQSVLLYGSETWALRVEDINTLKRWENWMLRIMCGIGRQARRSRNELAS